MYNFLSQVIQSKLPTSLSTAQSVAESRSLWVKDRQEKEALQLFLVSSSLGQSIAADLQTVGATALLETRDAARAYRYPSHETPPHVKSLEPLVEDRLYGSLGHQLSPTLLHLVSLQEAAAADAEIACDHQQQTNVSTPVTATLQGRVRVRTPVSGDTTQLHSPAETSIIKGEVARGEAARGSSSPHQPPHLDGALSSSNAVEVLPARLIAIQLSHWKCVVQQLIRPSSSSTTSGSSNMVAFGGVAFVRASSMKSVLAYLTGVLRCWNAVVESHRYLYAPVLIDSGAEACLLETLIFLELFLSDDVKTPAAVKSPASPEEKQAALGLLPLVLALLLNLYSEKSTDLVGDGCTAPSPSSSTSSAPAATASSSTSKASWLYRHNCHQRCTSLTNAMLRLGTPCRALHIRPFVSEGVTSSSLLLASSLPTMTTTGSVGGGGGGGAAALFPTAGATQLFADVSWPDVAAVRSGLARRLARWLLDSSKGSMRHRPKRTPTDSGLGEQETTTRTRTEHGSDEKDDAAVQWDRSVTQYCTCAISLILLRLRPSAVDVEGFLNHVAGASSVLLARLAAETTSTTIESCLHGPASCALVLTTQLMLEYPVGMLSALCNLCFFDNLCRALGRTAAVYPCTPDTTAATEQTRCADHIAELVSIESLRIARLHVADSSSPNATEPWAPPRMDRLADKDSVDELLHSYVGLVAAARRVRSHDAVTRDTGMLAFLDQIPLALIKTFLSSSDNHNCDDDNHIDGVRDSNTGKGGVVFCNHSCLCEVLMCVAIDAVPARGAAGGSATSRINTKISDVNNNNNTTANAADYIFMPGQGSEDLTAASRLVTFGLYRILLHEPRSRHLFLSVPHLHWGTLYVLRSMLFIPTAAWSGVLLGSSLDCVCAEVDAILDTMVAQRGTNSEAVRDCGCEEETVKLWGSLCALLVTALQGPGRGHVRSSLLASDAFHLLGSVMIHILANDNNNDNALTSQEESAVTSTTRWATQVLLELLRDDEAIAHVLTHRIDVLFVMLQTPSLSDAAERMLTSMLSWRCTVLSDAAQVTTATYTATLKPLVKCVWHAIGACEDLIAEEDTSVSSSAATMMILRNKSDTGSKDRLLLSILRCLRNALDYSSAAGKRASVMTRRALQHALCDSPYAEDCFIRLVHRIAKPWTPPLGLTDCVTAIVDTLTALVKGNPVTRNLLFAKVKPDELVSCIQTEWLSASPGDWQGFITAVLGLVYEEAAANLATCCFPPSIQNASLLLALLKPFESLTLVDEEEEEASLSKERVEAFQYLVGRMHTTMASCRASLFLVAQAGVFDALCRMLPMALSLADQQHRDGDDAVLQQVVRTMTLIASHHVDVKQLKQLIMMVVLAESAKKRERLCAVALGVISDAVSACVQNQQQADPQSYIAFRRDSGSTGVKALMPEFPADGYAVSLWLRLETSPPGAADDVRTIFSFQSPEKITVLELKITTTSPATGPKRNRVSVAYQDTHKKVMEADLSVALPLNRWTHVVVIHRAAQYLVGSAGKSFVLFVDGEEVTSTGAVAYPPLRRGYFFVGCRGEDSEQQQACATTTMLVPAQVTSMYLFPRAISAREVAQLYNSHRVEQQTVDEGSSQSFGFGSPPPGSSSNSNNNGGWRTGPGSPATTMTTTAGVGGSLGVGKIMADQAIVCVDPRMRDKGHMFNLSAVLRGSQRDSRLLIMEGSMVCNAVSMVDSLSVIGALHTVVIPFLVLLVNSELPFSMRLLTQSGNTLPPLASSLVRHGDDRMVRLLLHLIHSLSSMHAVRAGMVDSGLFALLAYVLQQLGPFLSMEVPYLLMSLCGSSELLTSAASLFDAAYTSLFLSSTLLRACARDTQLIWINCQRIAISERTELRERVRVLGLQAFVVAEIVDVISAPQPQPPAAAQQLEGDAMEEKEKEEVVSDENHRGDLREQLFLLLDALTVDPITTTDATALLHFISCLHQRRERIAAAHMTEALRRTRIMIASRKPVLCEYLGRKEYATSLMPFMVSADECIRHEALLQFILVVSQSRKAQELMQPYTGVKFVYLGWLKNVLQGFPIGVSTYMALRCAVVGDYAVRHMPTTYSPLTKRNAIATAPALVPLLLLVKRSPDIELKRVALVDLEALLANDVHAWRRLTSLPGWFILVINILLSARKDIVNGEDTNSNKKDSSEKMEEESAPSTADSVVTSQKVLFTACGQILSYALYQSLIQEADGGNELKKVLTHMKEHGMYALVNDVLLRIAEYFRKRLTTNIQIRTTGYMGMGGNGTALMNFISFVYCVEDTLFYSAPDTREDKYTEWEELLLLAEPNDKNDNNSNNTNIIRLGPQGLTLAFASSDIKGDAKIRTVTAPDGRWFHHSLALRLADLLVATPGLLNHGGSSLSAGPIELPFVHNATSYRRGGFIRIFARLMRVCCSMTLHQASSLDAIVALLGRFVQSVETKSSGFFLLRRVTGTEEYREHSALSVTMLLMYSIHDLLDRRLRASHSGGTPHHPNVNAALIDILKSLFALFRKSFEQLLSNTVGGGGGSSPFHAALEGERHVASVSTLQWLSDRSNNNANTADKVACEAFSEVASRPDYSTLLERCLLAMERDHLTEKSMAVDVADDGRKAVAQLHDEIAAVGLAEHLVADTLKRFLDAAAAGNGNGVDNSAAPMSLELSMTLGASTATTSSMVIEDAEEANALLLTAMRMAAWSRFVDYSKGTMWNADPAGQQALKYVRLACVEQQPLVHRKVVLTRDGTDHHLVTRNNPQSAFSVPQASANEMDGSVVRVRGGEEVLLGATADESPGLTGVDAATLPSEEDQLSSLAGGGSEDVGPVLLSIPCEVPYMMNCWSASFMIRGASVCIVFDEENTAYNQAIAEDAKPYLIRPRNFGFTVWNIRDVAPGRRFRMRRTAVEIWVQDRRSFFINFEDTTAMRLALHRMVGLVEKHRGGGGGGSALLRPFHVFHENPAKEPLLMRFQQMWRSGEMSNMDYLLWLNFFGGRSVNDMTQYPVFPWVLADYTSEALDLTDPSTFRDLRLPMGATGSEARREAVMQRYDSMKKMGDVPAHYFTHYSSAAVVIHFLVRLEPFTSLQIMLQGGHFDHPDRMFHSLKSSFRAATTSSQDVRELVPELYYLPELCINGNGVQFGMKQDGTPMGNLDLPPWAHGCPYEFIYRMREALESDYVSGMLHHWIDLVFGVRQRGQDAIDALNVFNWYSYENTDTRQHSSIKRLGREAAAAADGGDDGDGDDQLRIDSLDNIGQTPIKLFSHGHFPRRLRSLASPLQCPLHAKFVPLKGCQRVALLSVDVPNRVIALSGSGAVFSAQLLCNPTAAGMDRIAMPPSAAPTSSSASSASPLNVNGAANSSSSPSHGVSPSLPHSGLQIFSCDTNGETEWRLPAIPSGVIPNTTPFLDGPCTPDNSAVLCLGSEVFVVLGGIFDNSVLIRSLSGTMENVRLRAHSGLVTHTAVSGDNQFLVTGSEDTTFIVWRCRSNPHRRSLDVELLFTIYGHEDHPSAAYISSTLDLVATASADGALMLHTLAGTLERSLRHPTDAPIDRILIQSGCHVPNILFASRTDNVIHQVSINGVFLRSFSPPGRIVSWALTGEQYLLVHCVPLAGRRSAAASHHGDAEEGSGSVLLHVHSFFLSVLKTLSLPRGTVAHAMACQMHNPQVVVLGTAEGDLGLVRTSTLQSMVL